jgi:catechol 2,3-dioxygenase-like lactoylglutathione lyase family enzyme
MSVLSIDHVQLGFAAAQWTVVRHFYTHLLELPEVNESSPGRTLRLRAGQQRVDLVPVDPWQAPPPAGHLALRVRNLAGVRAKLRAGGFALDETRPLPGHLRCYVSDPAGNAIELLEPVQQEGA